VYAHLVSGADEKARAAFDGELMAPIGGWDAVERRIFTMIGEG